MTTFASSKQLVDPSSQRSMDSLVIHPVMKAFLAGSVSGTCSTILFQPLDLIKTRLQQKTTPWSQGMVATAREVLATDRTRGLWRGLVPSVSRTVPGVGIYFSSMHWLKSNLCGGSTGPLASVGVGMVGRCIAGITMIPVTVVKTRFESASFGYKSVSSALMMIYRTEGFRGLSAGLVPTLVRDAPFSGIYLLFYDQLKPLVPSFLMEANPNVAYFVCGLGAGSAASALTHPADVIKTKMQICEGKGSLGATVKMVYRSQGSAGFWRGLTPRLVRRTLMAALAWTVYENVMRNVGLK